MRTLLLLSLTGSLVAQTATQNTSASLARSVAEDVHVRLSVADNKPAFRIGERIDLVLTFTADRAGYFVNDDVPVRELPLDGIEISPSSGVVRWIDDYVALHPPFRDVEVHQITDPAHPVRLDLPLNYWFRFDEPGEYVVRMTTRRAGRESAPDNSLPPLKTNAVTLRILPMSERDEADEVRKLAAELAATTTQDQERETRICKTLAFLTGEAAAREKVRWTIEPPPHTTGVCSGALQMGTHITRNPDAVRSLLEAALHDSTRPVTTGVFEALENIRLWLERAALLNDGGQSDDERDRRIALRKRAIRDEYLDEIIGSLPVRRGPSRRGTAETILTIVGSSPLEQRKLPPGVRQILISEFAEFDTSSQLSLVGSWEDIRDRSLFPALAGLLEKADPNWHGSVLQAMIDIAPTEAKPYVVREILSQSSVDLNDVKAMPDATLAELDRPLLATLMRPVDSKDPRANHLFDRAAGFLARFASAAILGEVTALYDERGRALSMDAQVNLLSYLDRWNESATRPLIERALEETRDTLFVYYLAEARYGGSVAAILKSRLESDDPDVVSQTAGLMEQYGTADVRALIGARLARWRETWRGREPELQSASGEATTQGHVEVALARAWLYGQGWKLSPDDVKTIAQNCVTTVCRNAFQ